MLVTACKRLSCLALALLLAACATGGGERSEPIDFILEAAENPNGVPADVSFTVQGSGVGRGWESGRWFLNSEPDYRDFRSLNVVLMPDVVSALRQQHGISRPDELLGRRVHVKGVAQRRQIHFTCQGVRSSVYYFQTQLPVVRLGDIELL